MTEIGGDPIDVALVRAAARRKLFGGEAEPVKVSRFVVERRLGVGGMGVVYEARDPELNRKVALKLLHEAADADRLLAEARALAKLRHPNVVAVHDVGTWQGRVFLTMEHVEGGTLRSWLRARPRSPREIGAILARAARALAAAHAAGLVHRDVKPENVLVGEGGEVRVVDFGLARQGDAPVTAAGSPEDGAGAAARTGTRPAGTPGYVAPECLGGAAGDARSDQFSFCVTLYEALWGERPQAAAKPPADGRAPAVLRRAIARGLSTDPAARHPSMDAIVAALEHDRAATLRVAGLGALLVAAAVGITVAVTHRGAAPAPDPCAAGAARIAEIWNPARREALHAGFAASKLPYAEASFASTAAALDRYATAWSGSHRESCQATNVRHEQSAAVLDLRTHCLDQRRAALASTIELLARGEKDTVTAAARVVESLPPLDRCDDVAALSAPTPPPTDPQARAKLDAIQARIDEPITLAVAAQHDRGVKEAEDLLAQARALGYRPLIADALFTRAMAQALKKKTPETKDMLYDALIEGQASGNDGVVVMAAGRLMTWSLPADIEGAKQWERMADATLVRIGSPPRLVAEVEQGRGILANIEGKYAESVTHLEAAVQAAERGGLAGTVRYAGYLGDLANALDDAGKPEEAKDKIRQGLAIYEKVEGEVHPDIARMLNNLSAIEENTGQWQDAYDHIKRAYAIAQALGIADTPKGINYLRGQVAPLEQMKRYDEALAVNTRALAALRAIVPAGDETIADVVTDRGNVLQDLKRYREANEAYQEALDIYSKARGGKHPYVPVVMEYMGRTHLLAGENQQGLAACEKALALFQAQEEQGYRELGGALQCVGKAQLAMGRRGEGIATLERAVKEAQAGHAYEPQVKELEDDLARARK